MNSSSAIQRQPNLNYQGLTFFILAGIFLLFLATIVNPAHALNANSDIPSRTSIQNELNNLSARKSLTADDKLSISDLEKSLAIYDEIDELKIKSAALKQQIETAPQTLQKVTAKLSKIKFAGEEELEAYKKNIASLSLSELETKLNNTLEALQNAQNNLSTVNSELIALQTQPERAQNTMYANVQRLQDIRAALNNSVSSQKTLRLTEIERLLIEQSYLQYQMDYQKRALQSNTQLQNLLQVQRDYVAVYITQLESYIDAIQEVVSSKRLIFSEETAKEAQSADNDQSAIQDDPLIIREIQINHELSEKLIAATRDSNHLVQKSIKVKNWLDRALQSERNLKEQITVLRGSLLLSRILFKEQINLPADLLTANLPDTIADLRLEQFEVNQQRDSLYQIDAYVDSLIDDYSQNHDQLENRDLRHAQKQALKKIIDVRQDLLDQFNNQLGNQISQAINLQLDQKQLVSVVGSLEKTLAQQIFWVNSNKPFNLNWFQTFPQSAAQELNSLELTWSLNSLWQGTLSSFHITIPLILFGLFLRWRTKNINQKLIEINHDVGRLSKDSQLNTPLALFLVLVKTLPTSLLVIAFGYFCLKTGNIEGDLVWGISRQLAIFWILFEWSYRILKSDGIAVIHFNYSEEVCRLARRRLVRLAVPLLPILFWSVYGIYYPLRLVDDVIGQLVVPIALFFVFLFALPFCRDMWREKNNHIIRALLFTLLTFSPLVLIVLVSLGYYYTALRLGNRWIDSLYLLIMWYIVYHTCIRGLTLAARRLAYQRALARRHKQTQQNAAKESDDIIEAVDEPPMSMELISQQSLRLTTMVLFIVFATAFYSIWSDFITIFSFLDGISLWHYNVDTPLGNVVEAVTLGDIVLSILIIAISWILMRNLPGLLEVLILSRMTLQQGTAYAVTSILNYSIIAIGTIATLGALGVTWNKLQWLAAALTFGLSFGLQEIFANFVSGIILLFERPIRISDTVTVGNFSGTVNKIRIRATTIVDFDRKEVIIPNKAFMTERLINWTLSDTVTRIVIDVGVAYGSPLDKVKEILLKAAQDNPKVMTDPGPQVYFTTFGASTLDHQLRFYVRTVGDRSSTTDEVNRAIDALCRQHDINIAFNQLEVYLHNKQGEDVQILNKELSKDLNKKPDSDDPITHN